jgi:hypothetical protein
MLLHLQSVKTSCLYFSPWLFSAGLHFYGSTKFLLHLRKQLQNLRLTMARVHALMQLHELYV